MAKRWNTLEVVLGLGVLGILTVLLGVGGLFVYNSATAVPLHPDPSAVPAVTQSAPAQRWAAAVNTAREMVRAELSAQNLPGLSVAVGAAGELAWAEGFGWASIDGRTPVTPQTRFRIGTTSIPLTAVAAGLLIERGRLKLDEPIQASVADYPQTRWPITLRQLMAHTSGLRSDSGDEGPLFGERCERPADAFPFFAGADLRFEPDTEYNYSRFGFIPVSAAIEAASGESFLAFMQQRVFTPLGMDDTLADGGPEPVEDRAVAYFPGFAGDPRYGNDVMRDLNLSCYAGSSVFLSTASDLVRFGNAVAFGRLLSADTVRMLHTSHRLRSSQETGYGLGWDIESVTIGGQPLKTVGHDGDLLGGIANTFWVVPDQGLVIAVVSNTSYAGTPAIAAKIAEAFATAR